MENLITLEEQVKFEASRKEITRLRNENGDQEKIQQQIISDVFLRFLQQDKWVATSSGRGNNFILAPAGYDFNSREREKKFSQLLMEALHLGWHDHFYICSNGIYISGYMDDGSLTISLDNYGDIHSPESQEGLKSLKLDFDFGPLLREGMARELVETENEIKTITAKRDTLRKQLSELS